MCSNAGNMLLPFAYEHLSARPNRQSPAVKCLTLLVWYGLVWRSVLAVSGVVIMVVWSRSQMLKCVSSK